MVDTKIIIGIYIIGNYYITYYARKSMKYKLITISFDR